MILKVGMGQQNILQTLVMVILCMAEGTVNKVAIWGANLTHTLLQQIGDDLFMYNRGWAWDSRNT
jgi:hypothetical protein